MKSTISVSKGRGRPRSQAVRDAILSTTWALIEEAGLNKLTIEGVAERAGVGKTTIYRLWGNKSALAVEAFLVAVSPALAFTDSGSARQDIRLQMIQLAKVYQSQTGRIVCEMIGSGQFDPAMLDLLFTGYLAPRRAAAKVVLQRGIDQGEFRADIDFDIVIDALYSPLFQRVLIRHADNDEPFLTFVADAVFAAIAVK